MTFCPCPQVPPQPSPPQPRSRTIAGQLVYLPTPVPYKPLSSLGTTGSHDLAPAHLSDHITGPSARLTHCPFFWKTPSSLPSESACARYFRPRNVLPQVSALLTRGSAWTVTSEMPPWPPSCPPHPQVTSHFPSFLRHIAILSLYFADLFASLFIVCCPGILG